MKLECTIVKKSQINIAKEMIDSNEYLLRSSNTGVTLYNNESLIKSAYIIMNNLDYLYKFYEKCKIDKNLQNDVKYQIYLNIINNIIKAYGDFKKGYVTRSVVRKFVSDVIDVNDKKDINKIKKIYDKEICLSNKIILVNRNNNIVDIVSTDKLDIFVSTLPLEIEEYDLDKNILKLRLIPYQKFDI